MGGLGSGRQSDFPSPTLDDLPRFNIDRFAHLHGLGDTLNQDHRLSFGGSIAVTVASDVIQLSFQSPTWRDPGRSSITAHRLERMPCTKGGVRGRLICKNLKEGTGCSRRCRVLYFLDAQPMCRHCCGLSYRSQQHETHGPAFARLGRLRARLGAFPGAGPVVPPKPAHMHQSTYQRLSNQINEAFATVHAEERSRQIALVARYENLAAKGSSQNKALLLKPHR